MSNIQIFSMNCRGLGDQHKRRDILSFLKQSNYDVFFLQDTHLTGRSSIFLDTLWRGKCFHSFYSSNSRGTSILFKAASPFEFLGNISTEDGNFVAVKVKLGVKYIWSSKYIRT